MECESHAFILGDEFSYALLWTNIMIRFRWVELQLRHFCDLKFKPSIEQAMSDTTGASTHTVNQLYATIFDGISKRIL
jgi:hypothetical protein